MLKKSSIPSAYLYISFLTSTAMKQLSLLLLIPLISICLKTTCQPANYPATRLLTLSGEYINSSEILDGEVPTILIFWKSNETKCCDQIELMIDAKEKLTELTNVNIVAICTDTEGLSTKIRPLVSGKDWDIEVYIDRNEDFKRAMNIPSTPFTCVFDKDQNLICEYNGYCAWADDFICDKIKECLLNENQQPVLTIVNEDF